MVLEDAIYMILTIARPAFDGERETMDEDEEVEFDEAIQTLEDYLETVGM